MKIVHCCLSNYYIDNHNYQENALPRQNKLDGHDVSIIASTETFIDNMNLGYVEPDEYLNEDGILVRRIPYRKIPIPLVKRKIRSYQGLYQILEKEKPDVILFHNVSAWELKTVVRYKKNHPKMKLYVDNHADLNNSARNIVSKTVLHKMFYKSIIKEAYPYIDKILYVSIEAGEFLREIYKIPNDKMEFFPLGGTILESEERQEKRDRIRKSLGILNDEIMFVHSGKLGKSKKTQDILQAVAEINSDNIHLVIIGSIPRDMERVLKPLIEADKRVRYMGWKTADELLEYLCAADVYIQPGSQSATMQNSICCGCVVMLYPHKSHEPFLRENGFYVKSISDIKHVIKSIVDKPYMLKEMSENSMKIARELLDYKKLAAKLYI